jgi:hypothetical protein
MGMARRPRIPKRVETAVLTRSLRRCCVCFGLHRDETQKQGQIAHLDHDPSNNGLENLVWLCFEHHDQYDSRKSQAKGLTIDEVKTYRRRMYSKLEEKPRLVPFSARRAAASPKRNRGEFGAAALADPQRLKVLLACLDERIAEGELIHGAIKIEPGKLKRKWICPRDEDPLYTTPDRHIVDWERFVGWTSRCATLLSEMIPPDNVVLHDLPSQFRTLRCDKGDLTWGIENLKAIRADYESGILGPARRTRRGPRSRRNGRAQNAHGVSVSGNHNMVAGGNLNVTYRRTAKSARAPVYPGTVGEDPRMIGYLNYLVRRYNEFKKWDCDRTGAPMNYALIRVAYQREVKYLVKDTPRTHFPAAVAFLQRRIRGTTLGRMKAKSGDRLFSSFEEFDLTAPHR